MRSLFRCHAVVLLGALLAVSCSPTGTVPAVTTPDSTAAQAVYPENLAGAQLYRIDAAASAVHILVYRGGTLARMGHNHVVSSPNLAGYIWQHARLEDSGFDIVVPVNDLVVDDGRARAAQGADFPLNVPDQARRDTRENMLGAALLDGEHFPSITITSTGVSGTISAPRVSAALRIRNQTRELTVPVTLEAHDHTLRVRGRFEINQSDFGITPFSVALGALQVLDTVKISFDLVSSQIQPERAATTRGGDLGGIYSPACSGSSLTDQVIDTSLATHSVELHSPCPTP